MMINEDVIVIGAGPCGLAAAVELRKNGIEPLVIEKGSVVNAIYHYPTHQTFFSSSEKLEIGGIPFIINERKPSRNQALAYYREVVTRKQLRINAFEQVVKVERVGDGFTVESVKKHGECERYQAKSVIVATGYYDHPNKLNIPGENLPKVHHYFKEAHPYYDKDIVVIGGKNSAVDTALELSKVNARVTVLYRGKEYSSSIKPWILPEFEALVRSGKINMVFNAHAREITAEYVRYEVEGQQYHIKNDFVFAMIGYHPDHHFLRKMNVQIDEETGRPIYHEKTMETNVPGVFIAGVIAAGNNANEIFIENGRFHGELIAKEIIRRSKG